MAEAAAGQWHATDTVIVRHQSQGQDENRERERERERESWWRGESTEVGKHMLMAKAARKLLGRHGWQAHRHQEQKICKEYLQLLLLGLQLPFWPQLSLSWPATDEHRVTARSAGCCKLAFCVNARTGWGVVGFRVPWDVGMGWRW